jgi:hypothetical protein
MIRMVEKVWIRKQENYNYEFKHEKNLGQDGVKELEQRT